ASDILYLIRKARKFNRFRDRSWHLFGHLPPAPPPRNGIGGGPYTASGTRVPVAVGHAVVNLSKVRKSLRTPFRTFTKIVKMSGVRNFLRTFLRTDCAHSCALRAAVRKIFPTGVQECAQCAKSC